MRPADKSVQHTDRPTTQVTPDDLLSDGGAMPDTAEGADPTWREVVQDTVSLNPSADSMESRG